MNKYAITALLAALLCSGCQITEQAHDEINPSPTLILGYRYINSEQQNTLADEVERMDVLVFDSRGIFVKSLAASRDELTAPGGITILAGVPAGDYTIVSFGNIERASLPQLVPGRSTLDELRVTFDRHAIPATDRLFHSASREYVRREQPTVRSENLNKLFYHIDLTITGLDYLDPQGGEIGVELTGIAAGFDGLGRAIPASTTVTPELHRDGDRITSSFAVSRFDEQNKIGIRLKAEDQHVVDIPLSEYMAEHDIGIDFKHGRDVVIPVELDVSTAGVTIIVNGWELGAVQYPSLGE